jgi:hypothetical protein
VARITIVKWFLQGNIAHLEEAPLNLHQSSNSNKINIKKLVKYMEAVEPIRINKRKLARISFQCTSRIIYLLQHNITDKGLIKVFNPITWMALLIHSNITKQTLELLQMQSIINQPIFQDLDLLWVIIIRPHTLIQWILHH